MACWKSEEERCRVKTYKKNDSVLEVRRRKIECYRTYKKIDSVLKLQEAR